jgi:Flp pilus assembly protein TadG
MPHIPPPHRDERGQTLVEFALCLPIIAFILLGILQFGVTFNNYLTLTDAVRAGAREAAVGRQLPDPVGAAKARVRAAAVDLDTSPTKLVINVTSDWLPGHPVEVNASYPYKISLLGVVVKSGRIASATTERVE